MTLPTTLTKNKVWIKQKHKALKYCVQRKYLGLCLKANTSTVTFDLNDKPFD